MVKFVSVVLLSLNLAEVMMQSVTSP